MRPWKQKGQERGGLFTDHSVHACFRDEWAATAHSFKIERLPSRPGLSLNPRNTSDNLY